MEVIYKGHLCEVMRRYKDDLGKLAIQQLKPCGEPYTPSERKENGIEQYIFVRADEVVEIA